MNLSQILHYKYPDCDFEKDIILRDDGDGIYIKEWNISDPYPTQEDLDNWEQEFDLKHRQDSVREQRAFAYPTWQEQFDMLYWDKVNNTDVWYNTIEEIKINNPIPSE